MGFVTGSLVDGRCFRALVIVDQHSRQCVELEMTPSLPAAPLVSVVAQLSGRSRRLNAIDVSNGPVFTSALFARWAEVSGAKVRDIQPGRPMQNALAGSLIGRLRDECLNEHWLLGVWTTPGRRSRAGGGSTTRHGPNEAWADRHPTRLLAEVGYPPYPLAPPGSSHIPGPSTQESAHIGLTKQPGLVPDMSGYSDLRV
jgi:putative transposase